MLSLAVKTIAKRSFINVPIRSYVSKTSLRAGGAAHHDEHHDDHHHEHEHLASLYQPILIQFNNIY